MTDTNERAVIGTGPVYHDKMIQGSAAWLNARLGLLTASNVKLILTPTLKIAKNDKVQSHLYELLAQRVTDYVEPQYEGFDMMRGHADEIDARFLYSQHYEPVTECGFITNSKWGFTLGYSPDGLVGDDGLIECKSRKQKYQVQTIIENIATDTIADEYMMQVQAGLLISERKWCDMISYSGGLPMATIRVLPVPEIQDAIIAAATDFEAKLDDRRIIYDALLASGARLIPTIRSEQEEMH